MCDFFIQQNPIVHLVVGHVYISAKLRVQTPKFRILRKRDHLDLTTFRANRHTHNLGVCIHEVMHHTCPSIAIEIFVVVGWALRYHPR